MSAAAAVEMKLTRAALILMAGLAAAGATASLAGHADVASVFALAELDVIWLTLLATGIVMRRRGTPLLAGWCGIAMALPPAPVRRAIATEIGLLTAIARVVARRPPLLPAGASALSSKQGTLAIPVAFTVATAVEIVVLHLVIPSQTLASALTLISVYALLLLFGVIAVRWQHPHYITATSLVLRNGAHIVGTISLHEIDTVAVRVDGSATSPALDGTIVRLATINGCNISVKLKAPHRIKLTDSRRAVEGAVTEVRLAVDDARAITSIPTDRT